MLMGHDFTTIVALRLTARMAFATNSVHGKDRMKYLLSTFALIIAATLTISGAQAEKLSDHGEWSAFKTTEGSSSVCYAGSEPQKDEGDYTNRGDIYVLVTHRPAIKELDVVSIEAGYEYQKDSDATVKIGGNKFSLFTTKGNAWARDSDTDRKLVKAMKNGSVMVITGASWRGTKTKDTYSLAGFTAAYNAARKACGL
jgi:invasion protein IalB